MVREVLDDPRDCLGTQFSMCSSLLPRLRRCTPKQVRRRLADGAEEGHRGVCGLRRVVHGPRPVVLVEGHQRCAGLCQNIPDPRCGDQVGVGKVDDVFMDAPVLRVGLEVKFVFRNACQGGLQEPGPPRVGLNELIDLLGCHRHLPPVDGDHLNRF